MSSFLGKRLVENWKRPSDEVGVIMHLLEHYLRKEREDLNKKNVKLITVCAIE